MPAASANSRTFTFGSSNTMSRIFLIISGVVTFLDLPGRSASFVLVRSRLNLPIHFSTICLDGEDTS